MTGLGKIELKLTGLTKQNIYKAFINMPKKLHKKLKREARKKFGTTTSERAKKYIYGTLRKTGWKPSK